MSTSLMGLFQYEEDFLAAAQKLKDSGVKDVTLMSPIPMHSAEKIVGLGASPVRRYSLTGAILGAIGGFSLATFSALTFILPTGGRAIIAFPPFLVITYELTILIGVLATLLGFHVVSGLPAWRDAPYSPKTNVDRFSVSVAMGAGTDSDKVTRILNESGAEQVTTVEV